MKAFQNYSEALNEVELEPEISSKSKAFTNERLIALACSSENFQQALLKLWLPFLEEQYAKGLLTNYGIEFQLLDKPVVIFSFFTNQYHYITSLKAMIEQLADLAAKQYSLPTISKIGLGWNAFDKAGVFFENNFYMPEVAYALSPFLRVPYNKLIKESVDNFSSLLKELNEIPLNEEHSIQRIVAMQLFLSLSILKDEKEVQRFYGAFLNEIIESILIEDIDIEAWRKDYRDILHATYLNQKEFFEPYLEFLMQSFQSAEAMEEEWLNNWIAICKETALELEVLGNSSHKLIYTNEKHLYREKFLQHAIRSISNHHGVNANYELNLYYIIMKCLN